MKKRELEREIGKMINEIRQTEIQGWLLKIAIGEEDDIMQTPGKLHSIQTHLSTVLDKLALIERECKIRYNKVRRKQEE